MKPAITTQQYIEMTRETASYPSCLKGDKDELAYLGLGATNEFAEFIEKQDDGASVDELKDELGDCLWYLVRLFDALAFDVPEFYPTRRAKPDREYLKHIGKAQGIIKKVLRDGIDIHGSTQKRMDIQDLLNEAVVDLTCIARNACNVSMDVIMVLNAEKLRSRLSRGVICGSGDKR